MKIDIRDPHSILEGMKTEDNLRACRNAWIVFLATFMVYIPTIIYRFNCSDGNVCGILYRSHQDYDWEDYCGRYLLKFIAHLRSMYVFSWLEIILSIAYLTIGTMIVWKVFEIRNTFSQCITGFFIVLSPTFLETMPYYFASDSYILCFPLGVLGAFLLKENRNWFRITLSACLFATSMAIYQAYIFVAIVIFFFLLWDLILFSETDWKEIIARCISWIASGILALIMYKIGDVILRTIGIIYYPGSRFKVSELIHDGNWIKAVGSAYSTFYYWLFGNVILNNYWKGQWICHLIYLLSFLIMTMWVLWRRNIEFSRIMVITLQFLCIPIAVTGMAILDYKEPMSLMKIPGGCLLFVYVWSLLEKSVELLQLEKKRFVFALKWIFYGVTMYMLMLMVIHISIFEICEQYYLDKTNSLAQRIITKVEENYPEAHAGSSVFICGDVDEGNYPQNYRIEQASYIMTGSKCCEGMFTDNDFQSYAEGWNNYLNYNFGVEYEKVDFRTTAPEIYASDWYRDMPLFPEKGSVNMTDTGIIVVKLKE